jgi:hypothetical protein
LRHATWHEPEAGHLFAVPLAFPHLLHVEDGLDALKEPVYKRGGLGPVGLGDDVLNGV